MNTFTTEHLQRNQQTVWGMRWADMQLEDHLGTWKSLYKKIASVYIIENPLEAKEQEGYQSNAATRFASFKLAMWGNLMSEDFSFLVFAWLVRIKTQVHRKNATSSQCFISLRVTACWYLFGMFTILCRLWSSILKGVHFDPSPPASPCLFLFRQSLCKALLHFLKSLRNCGPRSISSSFYLVSLLQMARLWQISIAKPLLYLVNSQKIFNKDYLGVVTLPKTHNQVSFFIYKDIRCTCSKAAISPCFIIISSDDGCVLAPGDLGQLLQKRPPNQHFKKNGLKGRTENHDPQRSHTFWWSADLSPLVTGTILYHAICFDLGAWPSTNHITKFFVLFTQLADELVLKSNQRDRRFGGNDLCNACPKSKRMIK